MTEGPTDDPAASTGDAAAGTGGDDARAETGSDDAGTGGDGADPRSDDADARTGTDDTDALAGGDDAGGGNESAGGSAGSAAEGDGGADEGAVDSQWWYVAAGVVACGAALAALLAIAQARVVGPTAGLAVPLAYLGLALSLVLPAALYVDGGRVADAGGEWAPSRTLYAVGAVGGVLLPPVSVAVAALYLLRRHRHVGVP